MNYSQFINAVAKRADIPSTEAEIVTRATLETLADRVTEGEATGVAAQLPEELREHLHKTTSTIRAQFAESFDFDEFVRRVRRRAVPTDGDQTARGAEAEKGARAVLATVGETIGGEKLQGLMTQLSKDYWEALRPGMRV